MVTQEFDLLAFCVEGSDQCNWTSRVELNNALLGIDRKFSAIAFGSLGWNVFSLVRPCQGTRQPSHAISIESNPQPKITLTLRPIQGAIAVTSYPRNQGY